MFFNNSVSGTKKDFSASARAFIQTFSFALGFLTSILRFSRSSLPYSQAVIVRFKKLFSPSMYLIVQPSAQQSANLDPMKPND
jgi:hypothetical protein